MKGIENNKEPHQKFQSLEKGEARSKRRKDWPLPTKGGQGTGEKKRWEKSQRLPCRPWDVASLRVIPQRSFLC